MKRDEEARVWLSGLEAVKNKIGVKAVYDLSATPFFLQGSGYPEGTLFPWVVSDFSLVDSIEAGIVKVPRVPIADNSMTGDQPTYRDLWLRIREGLPKKGRKTDAIGGEPKLPAELQGALHSLYDNYRQSFERWQSNAEAQARGLTPPVFVAPIVGERSIHTLDDLKRHRDNEVAFLLAKLTLEKYFRQDNEQKTDRPSVHRFDADVKGWLFPQVLAIAKRWLAECVTCKDNTFPQLLLLIEFAHDAADRIYKAIVESAAGTPALRPILRPYDVIGSTRYVDFDTTKAVYFTAPDKCHISHVVADTGS